MAAFGKTSALAMLLLASLLAVTCAPGAQAAVPAVKVVDNLVDHLVELTINGIVVVQNGKLLNVNVAIKLDLLLDIKIKVLVGDELKLYQVTDLLEEVVGRGPLGGILNIVGNLVEISLGSDPSCHGISVVLKLDNILTPVKLCVVVHV
uniref:Uncharacterized protein n=1 Tax=Physcomitrium patens TaxID=3218 RepID=A0A2K1JV78_PHYPA|nr:hypothetical protein PHYPA_015203 [Physcomitrium patens]